MDENAFTGLIKVIPYQFYAFLALATVPILIFLGKDYGPMKRSQEQFIVSIDEHEHIEQPNMQRSEKEERPEQALQTEDKIAPAATEPKISIFLYPLGIMLLLIVGLIIWHATHGGLSSTHIRSTLAISYLAASLTCMVMMRRHQ